MNIRLISQKVIYLVVTIAVVSGCVISDSIAQKENPINIIVPGWVYVDFGIDNEDVISNTGKLYSSYDEFVGGLFDDGLSLRESKWIKPTYGNENLLWTFDSTIGNRKLNALKKSKQEFSNSGYEFVSDSMKIANTTWTYSGYLIKEANKESQNYKSYVLVCNARKGISVFYWGKSGIDRLQDNQSILQLLKKLSTHC